MLYSLMKVLRNFLQRAIFPVFYIRHVYYLRFRAARRGAEFTGATKNPIQFVYDHRYESTHERRHHRRLRPAHNTTLFVTFCSKMQRLLS